MRGHPGCSQNAVRQALRGAYAAKNFVARVDLDQCPATVPTTLRRLQILGRKPLDMLVLGDDDLLSLALARSKARNRIAALDLDPYILATIAAHAGPNAVDLFLHDLRVVLPPALHGSFDEVFTDPPYTVAGQLLFMHRALCALKRRGPADLYVSSSPVYIGAAQHNLLQVFLQRAGFGLAAKYDAFNCYKAPADVRLDLKRQGHKSTNWLHSDLFHYTRQRHAAVPRIPREGERSMYDYSNAEIA